MILSRRANALRFGKSMLRYEITFCTGLLFNVNQNVNVHNIQAGFDETTVCLTVSIPTMNQGTLL